MSIYHLSNLNGMILEVIAFSLQKTCYFLRAKQLLPLSRCTAKFCIILVFLPDFWFLSLIQWLLFMVPRRHWVHKWLWPDLWDVCTWQADIYDIWAFGNFCICWWGWSQASSFLGQKGPSDMWLKTIKSYKTTLILTQILWFFSDKTPTLQGKKVIFHGKIEIWRQVLEKMQWVNIRRLTQDREYKVTFCILYPWRKGL